MTIGILKTDTVRPEWVGRFGEYPDMFEVLLRQVDPSLEFQTWDAEAGELPDEPDSMDAQIDELGRMRAEMDETNPDPDATEEKIFPDEVTQEPEPTQEEPEPTQEEAAAPEK